ncbi:MAG TPA: hypothetical protein VGE01_05725, partial [Fimbriimonas sp.]
YPRGKGGLFLNQLKFDAGDPNPANIEKKSRLLATFLSNMGVGSREAPVVLPGVNAEYTTVDLNRWNNVYIRNREGQRDLFGDGLDLRHLVAGERYYADVPFLLTDYATAPVPQGILGEAAGIEVAKPADMLYFLHAAQVARPAGGEERPEVATYVVRYADGSSVEVPVRLGEEVGHWQQKSPLPLPNGRIGWAVPYPGAGTVDTVPVLYVSQWQNPKPQVPIASLDLRKGKDLDRARLLVLGVTVAKIRQ